MKYLTFNRDDIRSGIAPLELVMSLPFLVGLAAMIFSLANSSIGRSGAATEARHSVWQLRADPEASGENVVNKEFTRTEPLLCTEIIRLKSKSGMLFGNVEQVRQVYVGFGGSKTAESGAALLTRTWDYRDVKEFEESGPHFQVLFDMGGIEIGLIGAFSKLTNVSLSSLENFDQIADAEATGDKALEEAAGEKEKANENVQKERERILSEIEQLERDKQALIDQLEPLQEEYVEKKAQYDRDLAELRRLQSLGQPVPRSLTERIETNRNRLLQLDREIRILEGKIRAKQMEIDRRHEMLRTLDSFE